MKDFNSLDGIKWTFATKMFWIFFNGRRTRNESFDYSLNLNKCRECRGGRTTNEIIGVWVDKRSEMLPVGGACVCVEGKALSRRCVSGVCVRVCVGSQRLSCLAILFGAESAELASWIDAAVTRCVSPAEFSRSAASVHLPCHLVAFVNEKTQKVWRVCVCVCVCGVCGICADYPPKCGCCWIASRKQEIATSRINGANCREPLTGHRMSWRHHNVIHHRITGNLSAVRRPATRQPDAASRTTREVADLSTWSRFHRIVSARRVPPFSLLNGRNVNFEWKTLKRQFPPNFGFPPFSTLAEKWKCGKWTLFNRTS